MRCLCRGAACSYLRKVGRIRQVIAMRIFAGAKNGRASRNCRVCKRLQPFGGIQRARSDGGGRHIGIDDLVHETGIRAVFQQAADKIGQQIPVRANGGIDAAAGFMVGQHNVMQAFTHAVQALKFKGCFVGRHIYNGRYSMGVVGGKLWIDAVGQCQQLAGVRNIADISRLFAGEDGKAGKPQNLSAFYFGIPIGAFDKADHDLAVQLGGKRMQPVDDSARPPAVGLHDNTETIPAFERRVG